MQKIIRLICLIVFLVLVVATCMARTVVNQAGVGNHHQQLIKKRQINDGPCAYIGGNITICNNYTYGNISLCNGYCIDTYYYIYYHPSDKAICHNNTVCGIARIDTFGTFHVNGTFSLCGRDVDGIVNLCDNNTCNPVAIDGSICHTVDECIGDDITYDDKGCYIRFIYAFYCVPSGK